MSITGVSYPGRQLSGMNLRPLYMMKTRLIIVCFCLAGSHLSAQKVDSIFFNLYTDSLKKGQHNYINVDGKLSNGKWMPLTAKDIEFTCDVATFDRNELIIPEDFSREKVTVKAILKSNPAVFLEKTIWIKKVPDGALPTREEILRDIPKGKGRKN